MLLCPAVRGEGVIWPNCLTIIININDKVIIIIMSSSNIISFLSGNRLPLHSSAVQYFLLYPLKNKSESAHDSDFPFFPPLEIRRQFFDDFESVVAATSAEVTQAVAEWSAFITRWCGQHRGLNKLHVVYIDLNYVQRLNDFLYLKIILAKQFIDFENESAIFAC